MFNRENDVDLFNEIDILKKEFTKEISVKKQESDDENGSLSEYRKLLACRIYECGYLAEKAGYLQTAVEQYRRATLLVHDIEKLIKFNDYQLKYQNGNELSDRPDNLQFEPLDDDLNESEYSNDDCQSIILQLPDELLFHIMRWVVGSELDIYTLVSLGLVCQKFHSLAIDEQLWRLISLKIWPTSSATDLHRYGGNWMSMVRLRPHLLFHGCYLSRTSYISEGQATGDMMIAPFVLVHYFRVFRFRADGSVVMVTSVKHAQQIIRMISSLDRHIDTQESIMGDNGIVIGQYTVNDDTINISMIRAVGDDQSSTKRARKTETSKHHLKMSFHIKLSNHRPNSVLIWKSYSISQFIRNELIVTNFDVRSKEKFPPIIFSRVREFSSRVSEEHL